MIEKLLPFAEYFKEKTLFPTVKRMLNFCFALGISSFIFKTFYFKYTLLDLTDYKGQFEFIALGNFIVPFSIFFIVWALSNLLGEGIFNLFNDLLAQKLRSKILKYSLNKNETIQQLKRIDAMVQEKIIVKPKKGWIIVIYESFKKSYTPKEYGQLIRELERYKQKLRSDSILVFRALIAISIYFSIINYFGWFLLFLLFITLSSCIILLVLGYQIAELLPTVIQKVALEMENYLKENYPSEQETTK
jgi:hypothetical protein